MVNKKMVTIIPFLRPSLSATAPAPIPPIAEENKVTVAKKPASTGVRPHSFKIVVKAKAYTITSKASRAKPKKPAPSAFHSFRVTSRHQALADTPSMSCATFIDSITIPPFENLRTDN